MKEITTYGDQYGKWYEVNGTDGYCKTFKEYQHVKDYYNTYYLERKQSKETKESTQS